MDGITLFATAFGSLSNHYEIGQKLLLAFGRALRTTIQGVAAAFPAAGIGVAILSTGYWETVGYSVLAAGIAGLVSLLNNLASFLPSDPTQPKP
jgi:uncharacterized protein